MCIRDRVCPGRYLAQNPEIVAAGRPLVKKAGLVAIDAHACLLYTSDAADERSSVDLGGRRIITKKKTESVSWSRNIHTIKTNDETAHYE